MLLYYPFWMFMGFTLHFCIIFGTNLLTGGPTRIAVFLPISVFRRKGISNGVQTERNLRERSFWNKRNPRDLEWTSSNRGPTRVEGAPRGVGAPPCLVASSVVSWRPLQVSWFAFVPERSFLKVSSRLDSVWNFFSSIYWNRQKKQQYGLGLRLVG